MRNVVQSTLVSLDGATNDPGSWAMGYFNHESQAEALAELNRSDAMLMGRRTYLDLSARWGHETGPYADTMNAIPKYVFSSTLTRTEWANSELIREEVVSAVKRLKAEGDGDLVIYGYGQLGSALLEQGLLDRLRFSIHPIIVGAPTGDFRRNPRTPLELIDTHTRSSGVVVLTYRPASAASGRAGIG